MKMGLKRVFLALEVPDEIRQDIECFKERLNTGEAMIKWVEPENLHINLRFFGEISEEEIKKIEECSKQIADSQKPFELSIEGLGFFPNNISPRVLWLGCTSKELLKLRFDLEQLFEEAGLGKEKKEYKPHITLGRIKSKKEVRTLSKEVCKKSETRLGTFHADRITIFESRLSFKGPEYIKIAEFKLGG